MFLNFKLTGDRRSSLVWKPTVSFDFSYPITLDHAAHVSNLEMSLIYHVGTASFSWI